MECLLKIDLPWEVRSETMEEVPCILCSSKGSVIGAVVLNGVTATVRKCEHEGLMWLSPRPDARFYADMYGKHFYTSVCSEQYGYSQVNEESRRREKAIKNWDDIERAAPRPLNKNSYLEIGCATGEMLDEAAQRGWKQIVGNELAPEAAKHCESKGHRIHQGGYETLNSQDLYDLIFADNVIEHLADPRSFAQKMAQLLNPSGLLCLRLPNTPEDGPRLKLIDHTYHFNPSTLTSLLDRAGLKVEKVMDSGVYHGSEGKTILNMTVFAYPTTGGRSK